MFVDSENLLFYNLNIDYKDDFSNLILRRQYNDSRKDCFEQQSKIRENIEKAIYGQEEICTIDSNPFKYAS